MTPAFEVTTAFEVTPGNKATSVSSLTHSEAAPSQNVDSDIAVQNAVERTQQSDVSKQENSTNHSKIAARHKAPKTQQDQLTKNQPSKMPTPVNPDRLEHHLKRIKILLTSKIHSYIEFFC